mmetsp:Transcript_11620/g.49594  ORF Transcript_11620/g.49594 Transcript_11620/m.49594 type:complete len:479 (-) Transcript_11620:994-2430(-)
MGGDQEDGPRRQGDGEPDPGLKRGRDQGEDQRVHRQGCGIPRGVFQARHLRVRHRILQSVSGAGRRRAGGDGAGGGAEGLDQPGEHVRVPEHDQGEHRGRGGVPRGPGHGQGHLGLLRAGGEAVHEVARDAVERHRHRHHGGRDEGVPEGRQGLAQEAARDGRVHRAGRLGQELPHVRAAGCGPAVAGHARPALELAHGSHGQVLRHRRQVLARLAARARAAQVRGRGGRDRRLRAEGGEDGGFPGEAGGDVGQGGVDADEAQGHGREHDQARRGGLRGAGGQPGCRAGHAREPVHEDVRGGHHGLEQETDDGGGCEPDSLRDPAHVGVPRVAVHPLRRGEEGASRGGGALQGDRLGGEEDSGRGVQREERRPVGQQERSLEGPRGPARPAGDVREGARGLHGVQAPRVPALLLRLHRGPAGHPVQRQQPGEGDDPHEQVLPGDREAHPGHGEAGRGEAAEGEGHRVVRRQGDDPVQV